MKKMKIKQLIICLFLLFLYVQVAAQDSLKIYLQKGGKGLLDKDFDKAERNFLSALRFSPASFIALKNLGVVYSATGDQKKAKEYFENANKVNSVDAELNNNLGVIYSNENNILKAIAHFEKAVGYDSTKALYLTSLAQEYSKVRQIGRAIPLLYKARKLDAVNPLISYILGNCYAESNSYDSAKFYYLDSKSKGGNSWELNYFLGRVREKLGENELAIENYEEDASAMGRVATNQAAINMAKAHPLLGVGAGNFNNVFFNYTPDELRQFVEPGKSIHNVFLQIVSETGLIGLLLFSLILFKSFIDVMTLRRRCFRENSLNSLGYKACGLGAASFGYLVALQFLPGAYYSYIYIFIPLIAASKPMQYEKASVTSEVKEQAEKQRKSFLDGISDSIAKWQTNRNIRRFEEK